jgi:hypothetical protein
VFYFYKHKRDSLCFQILNYGLRSCVAGVMGDTPLFNLNLKGGKNILFAHKPMGLISEENI